MRRLPSPTLFYTLSKHSRLYKFDKSFFRKDFLYNFKNQSYHESTFDYISNFIHKPFYDKSNLDERNCMKYSFRENSKLNKENFFWRSI